MFDELLRELKRMPKSYTLSIELPLDDKGYLDRLCKKPECKCLFKVFDEDWGDKVKDEAAYCPKCGESREADEFHTPQQQKYIEDVGHAHMTKQLNKMMARATRRTRTKTISSGLFDIKMSLSHTPSRVPTPLAIAANEALRQDFECESCSCRYTTIGAGYFCPACGHNSATQDFDQTIATTLKAMELINDLKKTVSEKTDSDTAANFEQQLLEDQIENLVTALQRVTEALYEKIANHAPAPFNVFQRMDDASALWKTAKNKGYDDFLDSGELSFLKKMVQRRHKIGHAQGMVDDKYIERTGDHRYASGQRLVVTKNEVEKLAQIIVKLVAELRKL